MLTNTPSGALLRARRRHQLMNASPMKHEIYDNEIGNQHGHSQVGRSSRTIMLTRGPCLNAGHYSGTGFIFVLPLRGLLACSPLIFPRGALDCKQRAD